MLFNYNSEVSNNDKSSRKSIMEEMKSTITPTKGIFNKDLETFQTLTDNS
jgi:hypothetical protein